MRITRRMFLGIVASSGVCLGLRGREGYSTWEKDLFSDGAENLLPVNVDGRHGFIDREGTVVIDPRFEFVGEFSEGLAAVCDGGRWGYINATGEWAIPPKWEVAFEFSSGLAAVSTPDGWVFIDHRGEIAIPGCFRNAPQFSEGLAAVREGAHFGYIDTSGRIAIAPRFLAEEVESGLVWHTASPFSENLASIRLPGGLHGFIDRSGSFEIPPTFYGTWNFKERLAGIMHADHQWQFIDAAGSIACRGKRFAEVHSFSEGVAAVSVGDCRWGFIDRCGEWGIRPRPEWVQATEFSEGLAAVMFRDGGAGYIDQSGKTILFSRDWGFGEPFRNGIAPVARGKELSEWGYVDRAGKYLWVPTA